MVQEGAYNEKRSDLISVVMVNVTKMRLNALKECLCVFCVLVSVLSFPSSLPVFFFMSHGCMHVGICLKKRKKSTFHNSN